MRQKIRVLFWLFLWYSCLVYLFQTVIFFLPQKNTSDFQGIVIRQGSLFLAAGINHETRGQGARVVDPELAPFFFEKISLRTASSEMLQSVPGIGPALAERLILFRSEKGQIDDLNELSHIQGVGKKKLESFKMYLTL